MYQLLKCTTLLLHIVWLAMSMPPGEGHLKASSSYTPYGKGNGRAQRAVDDEKCSETAMAPFVTSYFSKAQLNYQKMFFTDLLFGREMYLPPDDKGGPLLELCNSRDRFITATYRAYKESMNNLAKCPPTTSAYYDKRRFVLFDFECVDHFKDMADIKACMMNNTMIAGKQCPKKCNHLRPLTARQMQMLPGKEIEKIFNRLNTTTLYNEACRYVNCFIDCLTEAMKAGCSKGSAELYSKESQLAFKTLNQIYAELEMAEEDWPAPCRALGSKKR